MLGQLVPSPPPLTGRTESGPVVEGMRKKLVRVMAGQVSLSPPPPLPPPPLTGKTESDPVVEGMRGKPVRVIAGRVSPFPSPPPQRPSVGEQMGGKLVRVAASAGSVRSPLPLSDTTKI